ncbi:MAG: ATP-dependent DNA helicase RecG [Candidatus Pacebacteria bacterium]|nr:ATP-dependent DNA helicase RecG [Candidatus Paceibacterota bacterium]
MELNLQTSIEKVPRVTSVYANRLKKLGIKTLQDLIFHFPNRYEDFSDIINISDIRINNIVCIQGKILEIENTRTFVKKMALTKAIVQDNSGAVEVIWFNQPYLIKNLKPGDDVCLAGKATLGESGLYLSSPIYEKIYPQKLNRDRISVAGATRGQTSNNLTHTGRIIPIYPETAGVSSRWLRYILKPILTKIKQEIIEILPKEIIEKENLMPIQKAIFEIHFPSALKSANQAKQRLAFEQLFVLQLFVLQEKAKTSKEKSIPIFLDLKIIKNFVQSLPFKLTNAQKKVIWQILKDLEKAHPMSRLLQGDVGSGKTIVAVMAGLNTVSAGYQIAFMAPTEILAKQHFKSISELLKNFNVSIGLLTSKQVEIYFKEKKKKIRKKDFLKDLGKGKISFLIGTHALIQKQVKFKNLALVILDEQHRFGIEQRSRLVQPVSPAGRQSSVNYMPIPHLLSMTATPIPRSLALTIYGNLDLCLIDEMPKGRKKVITKIILPIQRQITYEFIRKQVKKGRQVFVICPRIEPNPADIAVFQNKTFKTLNSLSFYSPFPADIATTSPLFSKREKLKGGWSEVKAVKEEYEKLSEKIFPDLKISMLHGKMKTQEKEEIMIDFKNKKTDVLVSTSVVEVGIDIPNASVIMIEGAERFGLAQLHQFRGRVGRSKYQSYCLLFTDSKTKKTKERLKALVDSDDGFELAEKDLKIRGAGDFIGKRQSGIPDIVMNALADIRLIEKTRNNATQILKQGLELKKYPLLRDKLKEFGKRVHLE